MVRRAYRKKKQKRLEKLKSFTRFSAYPIETTSIKDFIYRNKGNFQPASTVSLKFRGFIFLLGLLSPSLLFFSTPFSVSIEFPVSSPRPRCMLPSRNGKQKKKKNEGDGINESNSRTICRVYLCFYFRVRSRACLK